MATFLKQSTAVDVGIGPFLDSTDGNTVESALTITQPDIRLKKNAGAWAQKSGAQTLTHEENGWYEVSLSATDTDTIGILLVAIHESGALPVWREFMVLDEAVYDVMFGTVALATLSNITSGTITTATNVTTVNGLAAGVITAASIATGAIDADALAADAVAEIADGVWDEDATGHQTQGTFGQAIGDPAADTNTIYKAVVTDATGATVGVDAAAILADTGTDGVVVAAASKTGYALSAAGVQAIWDALTTALTTVGSIGKLLVDNITGDIFARLGAPAGASVSADIAAVKSDTAAILTDTGTTLDTAISAIKTQTDKMTFTVANQIDSNIQSVNDVTVNGTGAAGNEWGP